MDRKWWTLIAVSIGVFMLLLDLTIVNVALPTIERDFHAPLSDLQWVIDAYALTLAALLLTTGSLADRFGRRILFAIGIAIFTIGSLLCGIAGSATFLCIARGLQGVGGATMFSVALALISDAFRGADRGIAFGVFGMTTGVSVAVGPVLGGLIVTDLSWRWIFFVNVPLAAVALAITLLRVKESRNPNARRADWLGFVLFSSALASLVYGLIRASSAGWGAGIVVGCFAAFAVLLAAVLVLELRIPYPMLDLRLLRKPAFTGGLIAAFAVNGSIFSLLTYLTLYQQNILGFSALSTGLHFLALTGALFLVSGVAGRMASHIQVRALIGPGFILIGAGLLAMRGINIGTGWTHLIPGFILTGFGAGLVNTPLASTAVGVVEPARAGMASGINSTFRQVGTATGVAALGSLLATQSRSAIAAALAHPRPGHPLSAHAIQATGYVSGLNEILLIAAVVAFAGAFFALVLIRQRDFVTHGTGQVERTTAEPAVAA
ncbi:MAG: MFS transporter [Solirubrobacteraceae bacterium]|jgi:EmrB/QacA subfamily drug resistance transporter